MTLASSNSSIYTSTQHKKTLQSEFAYSNILWFGEGFEMAENEVINFSFSEEKIAKIFSSIGAIKGGGILAIRLKNYVTIRSITTDEQLEEMLYESRNHISKNLQDLGLQSKPKIFVAIPFLFAAIKLTKDTQKQILELDTKINLINLPAFDAQFTLTFAKIESSHPSDKLKIIRNMIGTLAHDNKYSGIIEYENDITEKMRGEYETLSNLKSAIKGRLARFAFQPIIDCRSGDAAYYECLLRIPNDKGELISAGRSIMLAEKYGIIHFVDEAAIEMAAKELEEAEDLKLSVNISNIGFLDDRLITKMKKCLSNRKVASRLIIEITETAVNNDLKKTNEFVSAIRDLGCKIAIDDFGAGSSSLSQLKNIKFDILKIDGSLIRDIANNEYDRFLVEMLVKIASEVGAKTVAEFVEDGSIAKYLLDLNVDYMQGNFFSPAQNFRSWGKK